VDDLIADAAKDSSVAASLSRASQTPGPAPTSTPAEPVEQKELMAAEAKKTGKKEKEKDKAMKMIYSDNEVSPEEKLANLERYRFDAATERNRQETTLEDATMPAVAGIQQTEDDVIDRTN